MSRHAWSRTNVCTRCGLIRKPFRWGWLFERDGKSVQGEFAGNSPLPGGGSVTRFRVPPCGPKERA